MCFVYLQSSQAFFSLRHLIHPLLFLHKFCCIVVICKDQTSLKKRLYVECFTFRHYLQKVLNISWYFFLSILVSQMDTSLSNRSANLIIYQINNIGLKAQFTKTQEKKNVYLCRMSWAALFCIENIQCTLVFNTLNFLY